MDSTYRIHGIELSPYSVKVRSYFRFKGLPHDFVPRTSASQEEFQRYARLPLIPVVVTPDGRGLQDSTPILETLEAEVPDPTIHPENPVARFVSALLEEFADEWGNKWMFHFRWAREVDQWSAAGRLAHISLPDADAETLARTTERIRDRMLGRVGFVGSSAATAPQIERSLHEAIDLLEVHLGRYPYLFGHRPSFGDFGLFAQLYEAWTDPTAGALIEARGPRVLDWIQRMLWPRVEGEFAAFDRLESTLFPLLEREVGGRFLPWSVANAEALAASSASFRVELRDGVFEQAPQKYHARSLDALRARYRASRSAELDRLLERSGCLGALSA